MAKNLEIPFLLDFYGEMLTKKQHDFLVYYYEEDLSLSEIAENEGITRQGVRDSIKRAEAQLFDMEKRLGLAMRFNELKKGVDEILECAEVINEYNLNHSLSREVNEKVARIKTLATFLKEG
ncbi:MAG: DNA-binding protein [Acetobacter sp.]|nr:DNA-binding protein [Bacteroides sp.]MCM1341531.1 DNA-binding protein [Acetobacter sp.]MCM1433681.1 DNA-binding protein [Clostridiales bacterium]